MEAHGGLHRWEKLKTISATLRSGGSFFSLHNLPNDPEPREVTAWLHEERICIRPAGAPDRFSHMTANSVMVKSDSGEALLERKGTPGELHYPLTKDPWGPLELITFSSYAMWTYLTTPFLMALPGFTVTKIAPWHDANEIWQGIRVEFPPAILSHSTVQHFYFGEDFLLRRHDYFIDVGGSFYATQYVEDMV